MDNKDKLKKFKAEKDIWEDKLKDAVPAKHRHRPKSYKAFVQNELRLVNLKIEKATIL